MSTSDSLWVVVLAAGDGHRVRALTVDANGSPVPKQFCAMDGRRSMFRWTLDRAAQLAPVARTMVVVAAQHRPLWERELAEVPHENVVVQPTNRGTAPGLLLPLLRIFVHRDRRATVLVLPSDHYVSDEEVLRETLAEAAVLAADSNRLVLLGMRPDGELGDYGWIRCASEQARLRRVRRFVEKPDPATAARLARGGALVNSFMMAGSARALFDLYARTQPRLLGRFMGRLRPRADASALDALYAGLVPTDFSRSVLEPATGRLLALPVPPCGWSDLGTPERVVRFRTGAGMSATPACEAC